MDLQLKGKKVLVTGGSSGIGKSIAEEFLKEGSIVYIASKNQEEVEKCISDLVKNGSIYGSSFDTADLLQVKNLVQKAVTTLGGLDILVNNAGVATQSGILEMTEEVWDKTLDINLRGYVFVSKETALVMKQNKTKGAIVNISSIAGAVGFAGSAAYCSSKHAIIGLTKVMALDLAGEGIRVNAIGPGVIETPMTKDFLSNEQWKQFFMMKIPMKRVGQPSEIAKTAVFMASDTASYMTGATVFIDGGWLAG